MSQDVEKIWSLGFLPGELRSHPGKKLIDHLQKVAVLSEKLAVIHNLNIDLYLLKGIALTHDLGKAHPNFQAYLDKKGTGVNHAEPSAWYTYLLTHDLWAAEIVRRHHTHLRNCNTLINEWMPDGVTEEKTTKILEEFLPEWPVPLTRKAWKEFEDLLEELEGSIEQWVVVRLLYSVLIAADRMEALGIMDYLLAPLPQFLPHPFNKKTKLDSWRQQIHQICMEKAEGVNKPGVYTLTLPTGAGKTLLGLKIARKWADKFDCRNIIYALPFISIVEQNADEAKRVFGSNVQEDHSLAFSGIQEVNYHDDNDILWHRMMSLFRYWREPVVVTTMVQLWETLFNERANKSMNFHKLSRAIVILDEPQSISPKLWKGLSKILKYLSCQMGTTFLFMTATQPQIEALDEIAPADLSCPFERHRYVVEYEKYEIDGLMELLQARVPVREESGLIVLNSKKAALQVYTDLKKTITDGSPLLFLSAWMAPRHRKQILEQLRNLEESETKRYLVATQVVEAGVNLDFDWVFRDMGPLDSIIQVAGRCNRHLNRNKPGLVLVAELLKGNYSYTQIYNDILINAAREVLLHDAEEAVEFGEEKATKLVKEYYDKIIKNGVRSEPIYENLTKGIWEDMPPLIKKQNYAEVDVIIELDDKVRSIYEQLQSKQWTLEERSKQKELMGELRQYMITIPEKYTRLCRRKMSEVYTHDSLEPFGQAFGGQAFFITKDGIKAGLYDEKIGFIPPSDESSGLESIYDED